MVEMRTLTYLLETKTHGQIDAGFFSFFTGAIRIGTYAFVSAHFYELVQQLAIATDPIEERILAYSSHTFSKLWERALGQIISNPASYDAQTIIPDLDVPSKTIVVKMDTNWKSIFIGDYEIARNTFAGMIWYLIRGGWVGWVQDIPKFIPPVIEAIKASQNPLFNGLKKLMS